MKKIILPILVCLLAVTTVRANELPVKNETVVTKPATSVVALCDLIKKGDYNGVKSMLKAGQKVNEKSRGFTPLMYAARHNQDKIAKLLLGYGADVNAVSDKGNYTALKLTREYRSKETYYVLKAAIDKQAKKKNS